MVAPAAQAADVTVNATFKISTGAAAANTEVALCSVACLGGGQAADYGYTNGRGVVQLSVPAGNYRIAVVHVDDLPGYGQAPGAGYLRREPNGQFSITPDFGSATAVAAASSVAVTLANGIHNPKNKFTQTTSGSVGFLPCAGHTTTFKPTPFSDLPSNGTVRYQWYAGASSSTMAPISGARGTSYRPSASLVGKSLYVSMIASAPNRISYDQVGSIGTVGNPVNCNPHLAPIPKKWIKSYGKKHGKAKAGKKVSVAGAKAKSKKYRLKVSYSWALNGKVVGHRKGYKIPRTAKHQKLTVKVTFARSGYKPKSKTIKFGTVK